MNWLDSCWSRKPRKNQFGLYLTLVEEYFLSIEASFSVKEYFWSSSSPIHHVNSDSCEEFSIEEYDVNNDTNNEANANETLKIMGSQPNNNVTYSNVVTPISSQEKKSESHIHIRRIPCSIRLVRFNLVKSDKKLGFDVNKTCCARGCMPMIGKAKLQELRRHYFLMTSDEHDTYLCSHMQLVSNNSSGIKVSFEYYIFHV